MAKFGAFGSTVADAQASEFMQWFSLEEQLASAGEERRYFRPSGEAFKESVCFIITCTGDKLQELDLELSLAFVSGPRTAPFAADIAASFLRALGAQKGTDLWEFHGLGTYSETTNGLAIRVAPSDGALTLRAIVGSEPLA